MNLTKNFRKKVFAIYGLGSTGNSVINFFKKNKIKKYYMWDDDIRIRRKFKILPKTTKYIQLQQMLK